MNATACMATAPVGCRSRVPQSTPGGVHEADELTSLNEAGRAWSRRVSFESRKGTCVAAGSARALMHMPSVVSDRLMLMASLARRPARQSRL